MLSKTGIHAIRAIAALAELEEWEFAGAVSLAEKIGAPRNYLGKLLQNLSHEGLVESQKGSGGGFRLARDSRDISLYDIINPIEHTGERIGCILGRETCSEDNPCPLHVKWKKVREQYIGLLKTTSVLDLIRDSKKYTSIFS